MSAAVPAKPRAIVIANRKAGPKGRNCTPADIATKLQAKGFVTELIECRAERTIAELRSRLSPAPAVVVTAGGDGTLNLVANALAQTGIPLCIVPCGTANDLAGTLEIPTNVEDALALIQHGTLRKIDLGHVNGRYFINVASLGVSAKVAQSVQSKRKRRWGKWAYLIEAIHQLRRTPSDTLDICIDQNCERIHAYQVSIANGERFGGGWRVANASKPDDGMLDMVVLAQGRLHLRRRRNDKRALEQLAEKTYHATHIDIDAKHSLLTNLDGETLRLRPPLHFEVFPGALTVYVQ